MVDETFEGACTCSAIRYRPQRVLACSEPGTPRNLAGPQSTLKGRTESFCLNAVPGLAQSGAHFD
jgi:hypothetical protein